MKTAMKFIMLGRRNLSWMELAEFAFTQNFCQRVEALLRKSNNTSLSLISQVAYENMHYSTKSDEANPNPSPPVLYGLGKAGEGFDSIIDDNRSTEILWMKRIPDECKEMQTVVDEMCSKVTENMNDLRAGKMSIHDLVKRQDTSTNFAEIKINNDALELSSRRRSSSDLTRTSTVDNGHDDDDDQRRRSKSI